MPVLTFVVNCPDGSRMQHLPVCSPQGLLGSLVAGNITQIWESLSKFLHFYFCFPFHFILLSWFLLNFPSPHLETILGELPNYSFVQVSMLDNLKIKYLCHPYPSEKIKKERELGLMPALEMNIIQIHLWDEEQCAGFIYPY